MLAKHGMSPVQRGVACGTSMPVALLHYGVATLMRSVSRQLPAGAAVQPSTARLIEK